MKHLIKNNFILNGFDRSGTSAIARTLACHPDMELIMQPFNSGSIRQKLHHIIDDQNATDADYEFFSALERGELLTSYINSHWHDKYSTVRELTPGKIHIIKTTQNHLAVEWAQRHFPDLEHWGIWREPMAILASLVRNGFHITWYSNTYPTLLETVMNNTSLRHIYYPLSKKIDNPVREMAYIISVRTWFYFSNISKDKVLHYNAFTEDSNEELSKVLDYFSLSPHDFSAAFRRDLNIVGKQYKPDKSHHDAIPSEDYPTCREIFSPLDDLFSN